MGWSFSKEVRKKAEEKFKMSLKEQNLESANIISYLNNTADEVELSKEGIPISTIFESLNPPENTLIDNSSLINFLKISGSPVVKSKETEEVYSISIKNDLLVNNNSNLTDGNEEKKILKEVGKLAAKDLLQKFYMMYIGSDGPFDEVYRLGEVESELDSIYIQNKPYLTTKIGGLFTPINLNFDVKWKSFTGKEYSDNYYNLFFPPYNTPFYNGLLDDNSYISVEEASNKVISMPKFSLDTLVYSEKPSKRYIGFKAINDNISLMQYFLEKCFGICSTYITEWDLSLYMQEGILLSDSENAQKDFCVNSLTYGLLENNPSNISGEINNDPNALLKASTYGTLNCGVSSLKVKNTGEEWNQLEFVPNNYYLSRFWTPYSLNELQYIEAPKKDYLEIIESSLKNNTTLSKSDLLDIKPGPNAFWNYFIDSFNHVLAPNGKICLSATILKDNYKFTPNYSSCIKATKLTPSNYLGITNTSTSMLKDNLSLLEFLDMQNACLSGWESLDLQYWKQFYTTNDDSLSDLDRYFDENLNNSNLSIFDVAQASLESLYESDSVGIKNYINAINLNLEYTKNTDTYNSFLFDSKVDSLFTEEDLSYSECGLDNTNDEFSKLKKKYSKRKELADSAINRSTSIVGNFPNDLEKNDIISSDESVQALKSSSNELNEVIVEENKVLSDIGNYSYGLGIAPRSPFLFGGPHGKYYAPDSIEAFFEYDNINLKNNPKIPAIVDINKKNKYTYQKTKFFDRPKNETELKNFIINTPSFSDVYNISNGISFKPETDIYNNYGSEETSLYIGSIPNLILSNKQYYCEYTRNIPVFVPKGIEKINKLPEPFEESIDNEMDNNEEIIISKSDLIQNFSFNVYSSDGSIHNEAYTSDRLGDIILKPNILKTNNSRFEYFEEYVSKDNKIVKVNEYEGYQLQSIIADKIRNNFNISLKDIRKAYLEARLRYNLELASKLGKARVTDEGYFVIAPTNTMLSGSLEKTDTYDILKYDNDYFSRMSEGIPESGDYIQKVECTLDIINENRCTTRLDKRKINQSYGDKSILDIYLLERAKGDAHYKSSRIFKESRVHKNIGKSDHWMDILRAKNKFSAVGFGGWKQLLWEFGETYGAWVDQFQTYSFKAKYYRENYISQSTKKALLWLFGYRFDPINMDEINETLIKHKKLERLKYVLIPNSHLSTGLMDLNNTLDTSLLEKSGWAGLNNTNIGDWQTYYYKADEALKKQFLKLKNSNSINKPLLLCYFKDSNEISNSIKASKSRNDLKNYNLLDKKQKVIDNIILDEERYGKFNYKNFLLDSTKKIKFINPIKNSKTDNSKKIGIQYQVVPATQNVSDLVELNDLITGTLKYNKISDIGSILPDLIGFTWAYKPYYKDSNTLATDLSVVSNIYWKLDITAKNNDEEEFLNSLKNDLFNIGQSFYITLETSNSIFSVKTIVSEVNSRYEFIIDLYDLRYFFSTNNGSYEFKSNNTNDIFKNYSLSKSKGSLLLNEVLTPKVNLLGDTGNNIFINDIFYINKNCIAFEDYTIYDYNKYNSLKLTHTVDFSVSNTNDKSTVYKVGFYNYKYDANSLPVRDGNTSISVDIKIYKAASLPSSTLSILKKSFENFVSLYSDNNVDYYSYIGLNSQLQFYIEVMEKQIAWLKKLREVFDITVNDKAIIDSYKNFVNKRVIEINNKWNSGEKNKAYYSSNKTYDEDFNFDLLLSFLDKIFSYKSDKNTLCSLINYRVSTLEKNKEELISLLSDNNSLYKVKRTPQILDGLKKEVSGEINNGKYNILTPQLAFLSYLQILYRYREYFINKRLSKKDGTMWQLRQIEKLIPTLEKEIEVNNKQPQEALEDASDYSITSYKISFMDYRNGIKEKSNSIINTYNNVENNKPLIDDYKAFYIRAEYLSDEEQLIVEEAIENNSVTQFKKGEIGVAKDQFNNLYYNGIKIVYVEYRQKYIKVPEDGEYFAYSTEVDQIISTLKRYAKMSIIDENEEKSTLLRIKKAYDEVSQYKFNIIWDITGSSTYTSQKEPEKHTVKNKKDGVEGLLVDASDFLDLNITYGLKSMLTTLSPEEMACALLDKNSDYWYIEIPSELSILSSYISTEPLLVKSGVYNISTELVKATKTTTILGLMANSIYPIKKTTIS